MAIQQVLMARIPFQKIDVFVWAQFYKKIDGVMEPDGLEMALTRVADKSMLKTDEDFYVDGAGVFYFLPSDRHRECRVVVGQVEI